MPRIIRILAVPHEKALLHEYASLKSEFLIDDLNTIVVTSLSKHTLATARLLSRRCHLLSSLSVSGKCASEDVYKRKPKSVLLQHKPWLQTLPGFENISELWWPANYCPWKKTNVPTFIRWIHMQSKDKHIVAVCTLDYANELSKQLLTIPLKDMEAGEWRTISLHNGGSNTFMPHESYSLKMNYETTETWKQSINNVIAIYCNIKDTPLDAMWAKAEREWFSWFSSETHSSTPMVLPTKSKKRCHNTCVECDADISYRRNDLQSGDEFCSQCGFIVSSHHMNDTASFRTFEGEVDLKNHHATSVDTLMSVQTQLQTTCSLVNGSQKTNFSNASTRVERMMLENIETRLEQTTQDTKDKHIRKACEIYKQIQDDPMIPISYDIISIAQRIYHYKRNHEKSLQPVGVTQKYRPNDDTEDQHIATSLLAGCLHYRQNNQRLQQSHYCRWDLMNALTWEEKKDAKLRKHRRSNTIEPVRKRKQKRMVDAASMRASAKARIHKRSRT